MIARAEFVSIARLEFAEFLRSRWIVFCLLVYAVLTGVFVLVGLRESTVIGFTGMGRVLLSFSHVLVFLLPLLGLGATAQIVNGARDDGTLELLFAHPLSRQGWFASISIVRFVALLVPLVILLPVMAVIGSGAFGQVIPWGYLGRVLLVSTSLLYCSVAFGLAVSTFVRNQAKALMLMLLVWAVQVALIDFGLVGLMLQWRMPPEAVFAIAALNPVQDARLALLFAADPELATLGPVGFFLVHRLGHAALFAIGIAWPVILGTTAWFLSVRRFHRGDLV
ncbi:MAG: ABC transporter permease subunit [Planctomycetes bacterium]|nr:ABC transporter permease subunit [Planctomycetota bacterium]